MRRRWLGGPIAVGRGLLRVTLVSVQVGELVQKDRQFEAGKVLGGVPRRVPLGGAVRLVAGDFLDEDGVVKPARFGILPGFGWLWLL